MNKVQFQQILKAFYKGNSEIICKNPRLLPIGYTFDNLKSDALKYGYNYKFNNDKTLVIKLTARQESEIKMLPQ